MASESIPGPRERLLETAERLIYASSIQGTGVDAIVRESGTARKSFYLYFDSKEALVAEALRRRDARWMAWFEDATRACAKTPAKQLLGMFDVLRAWFASGEYHGCAFLNAASEIKSPEHAIFEVSRLHKARLLDFIAGLAEQAGVPDPLALAQQWLVLVDGAIAVALVSGRADSAEDAKGLAACMLASLGIR
ncbi:TetR/AcrR family transcriptional regulator [Pararobbsia silviterrae]|uniref:TetR/AcrR family transcriptional regulator n=1 Tax=Pararobbsia silviterrae TaxID=1792498 RepID=A0A494XA47_9BURK|nr:TetR/AcrR family transcriptional regulator [Pararobbsia silviterrae]RKP44984.1 TetR/AcrR family transcriptional regulator [Pararobbsia silviterrae]